MSTRVDICICTYQRPHVVDTLRSIAAMARPAVVDLHVLVADNDAEPSAQTLVAHTAETLALPVTYVHAPARNISIARNACLAAATGEYVAFIDDDELVSEYWLGTMLDTLRAKNTEIMLGPVQAMYPANAPYWLTTGDFHSTQPVIVNGKIRTGYTGNVMMRRAAIEALRFDEALGVTGGEDTDFFTRATAKGLSIGYAPDAVAYETVMPERCRFAWLIARLQRFGKTHAASITRARHIHGVIAAGKAALSFAVAPLLILFPAQWRYWLLRGVFHASAARALLGA